VLVLVLQASAPVGLLLPPGQQASLVLSLLV